jgi:predicted NAD/FAD-dependent oxidoreductase
MPRIAIIGAGIAGATLANRLISSGFSVDLFEKSRGTGGRLASTRVGQLSADLGAPYLDGCSTEFERFLNGFVENNVVESWSATRSDFNLTQQESIEYKIGVGRNSLFTRELLNSATFHPETRIGVVWRDKQGVLIRDDQGELIDYFDAVVVATPAPQAVPLLETSPRFAHRAEQAVTSANWIALFQLDKRPSRLNGVSVVEGEHPHFYRMIVESDKPEREGVLIRVEMRESWSQSHIDDDREQLLQNIQGKLSDWLGESLEPSVSKIHRWLYSRTLQSAQLTAPLWDADLSIGACGDWINEPGLEGAWKSANELADVIIDSFEATGNL